MSTAENPIDSRVIVIDSGDATMDRYTAIIDGDYDSALGMSEHPFHPQGFGMHVTASRNWVRDEIKAGNQLRFSDCPPDVQACILQELDS